MNSPVAKRLRHALLLFALVGTPSLAGDAGQDVEATTASGEKVIPHPNGRWDFVDAGKAQEAREVAKKYPENQGCPPGSQGSLFGLGRCVAPGHKDFNRGSLGGKNP